MDETESNLRMARACVNMYYMALEDYNETKEAVFLKDASEALIKAAWWLDQINTTGDEK